jgi:hypothetical protein
MRLIEFASAEEQIELWKLVSASVWSSLQQQQHQQRQAQATAAAGRAKREAPSPKRKRKRATGKGKLKLPRVSIPSPKAAPPPPVPQAQAVSSQNRPTPNVQQQSVQQNQQLLKPNVQNQRSVPQPTAHAGKVPAQQPAVAIPNAVLPVADAAVGADNRGNQPNAVPTRVPVNTVRQRGATGPETAKRR